MLDNQRMPVTPSRGRQENWLALQGQRIEQIYEVLEKPRLAAFIGRGSDHKNVSRQDLFNDLR